MGFAYPYGYVKGAALYAPRANQKIKSQPYSTAGNRGNMSYRIVIDSCGDLTEELKKDERIVSVPLTLRVDGVDIIDDETFDQKDFLARVAASPECPKSACPSPEAYKEAYITDADRVYVVTLSSKLSGSYNSAMVGRHMYEEASGEGLLPKKDIHVFDSWSACGGQTQIAMRVMELEEEGLSFAEVVERGEEYKRNLHTYFVLDNLETLRKNGRMSNVKAFVAATLKIKPVMSAIEGAIIQKGQAIGIRKALDKLCDMLLAETDNPEGKRLVIDHCNNPERAEIVKQGMLKRSKFKDIRIVETAGCATMYANDGGIVVTI